MYEGTSIFGGPVEAMQGAVRSVSIMPHYVSPNTPRAIGFGQSPTGMSSGAAAHHPMTGLAVRKVGQTLAHHPHAGPPAHAMTPHAIPHAGPTGGGQHVRPGPTGHMYPRHPHHGAPRPAGNGGGFVPQQPQGGGFVPQQPYPVPTPGPCAPCAPCGGGIQPYVPPSSSYNPTPNTPICGGPVVPYPMSAQMRFDACGRPIQPDPMGAQAYMPGGSYPITNFGPSLYDPHQAVTQGQFPIGGDTDIFGASLIVEDPTAPRMIGPPGCGPGPQVLSGGCYPQMPPEDLYNESDGMFGNQQGDLGGWY